MTDGLSVDLFCEDSAHERFALALLKRLARGKGTRLSVRPRSTRGGHGAALTELRAWQRTVGRGGFVERPDLLVVVIDANCRGANEARADTERAIRAEVFPEVVVDDLRRSLVRLR